MTMTDVRLPTVRDRRKSHAGALITKHDLLTDSRTRWTALYKAAIAECVRDRVITIDEACEQFCTTAAEILRWIELLELRGPRALMANHFDDAPAPEANDGGQLTIESGRVSIDFAARRVRVDGHDVHLTKMQFRFLTCLVRNAPNPVSRETIYTELYSRGGCRAGHKPAWKILDVMVCKMRQAIGADAIETVWGRGWKWNGVR